MKPSNRARLSDRQVQAKLAKLKKIGLYNGNARKAHPTDYGRRQLRKYMDVLEGKAAVVTVPRREAKEYRESLRVKGSKVVVPKRGKEEKVRYSKKDKTIYTYRTNAEGEQYRRETVKFRPGDVGSLPALKRNQVYAVPFNRWGKTEFINATSKEELQQLISQYESKYKDMLKYVQILDYRRNRKAKWAPLIAEDDGEGDGI